MVVVNTVDSGCISFEKETFVRMVIHEKQSNLFSRANTCVIKKSMDKHVIKSLASESSVYRELSINEVLKVSFDCLIAMSPQVVYDFQVLGNNDEEASSCIATMLGPGSVWLQSTTFSE